ncbi:LPD29 domain-containing protein [Priestia megaterium]|uniref:LPD29 domain-containing protein n=1 Tax=Priestia megaterium TaxID=1404 RepID=UPI0035D55347
MQKDTIYEYATETAKKIKKELKKAFPKMKFSVTSSKYAGGSSVYVKWIDGPMDEEVKSITNKFKGASVDITDMKVSKSYEYEGKFYNGADFVNTSRKLSTEYKAKIVAHAKTIYEGLNEYEFGYYQKLINAEKDLLQSESNSIENHFEEKESRSKVRQASVINFGERKEKRDLLKMTPEQKLKLMTLEMVFKGKDDLLKTLFDEGQTIDELFSSLAKSMFEINDVNQGYIKHFVRN